MIVLKKVFAGLLGLHAALAMAQTQAPAPRVIETATARVEVLGAYYPGKVAVSAEQARIVVYSPEALTLTGATSLFVNGVYHASLIKGAYTDLCYSPGIVELGARQAEVGLRPKDRPDSTIAVQLRAGQPLYLRVSEQGGRPILQTMAPTQAEQDLMRTREQMHTISRVAQACIAVQQEPAPAPQPVAAPRRHTLAADMLFASARSDRQGMTTAGLLAIDRLVDHLRKEYVRIDSMHIIGHADPLGSNALNERLSLERAQTIRQYIESRSERLGQLTEEGRGSRELVVSNCSRVRTPEARLCNQPNRRVEIEVVGTRRQ